MAIRVRKCVAVLKVKEKASFKYRTAYDYYQGVVIQQAKTCHYSSICMLVCRIVEVKLSFTKTELQMINLKFFHNYANYKISQMCSDTN